MRHHRHVRREPLPPNLATAPFAVRNSGLPRKRTRASDLDQSVHGVRIASPSTQLDVRTRSAMFAVRLRDDSFFSHTTAALLHGAPLPLAFERATELHVAVPIPAPSPHASGLIGHRLDVVASDVVLERGIRVTSPARTWIDLAGMLGLGDLVAVGDYFIHWQLPLTTMGEIHSQLRRMGRRRGVALARTALGLLNDRAESRPESRLRVVLVTAGFADLSINHVLVDSETGRYVRPDFMLREFKLIIEYQGDYHRTAAQWRKDMTRRTRLEAQGWRVIEVNADDLANPVELVARIRSILAQR